MILPGTTIHAPLDVYTAWGTREGDNLIVQFEIIAVVGSSTSLKAEVFTKSSDEVGDGTAIGSIKTMSGTGLATLEITSSTSGLKDLVRLRLECVGAGGEPAAEWVNYRILELIWYDTPDA